MNLPKFAAFFLLVFGMFSWGSLAIKYDIPPGKSLNSFFDALSAFAKGHELEQKTSVVEKVKNDFFGVPARDLFDADVQYSSIVKKLSFDNDFWSGSDFELSGFFDPVLLNDSGVAGVAFMVQSKLKGSEFKHYILVVNAQGSVVRIIDPSSSGSDNKCDCSSNYKFHFKRNDENKQGHLVQLNSCGSTEWVSSPVYDYHHFQMKSRTPNSVWAWDGLDLVQHSIRDGSVRSRIKFSDILNNNPDLHIFEPRLHMSRKNWWFYGDAIVDIVDGQSSYYKVSHADLDPFHPNDVEPLDERKALAYDKFEARDLLISFRSLNLIFVYRPATEKIVWFSYGLTSRQHDPDWNDRGTITVFDNRFHNKSSEIVEIDPNDMQVSTIVSSDVNLPFFKPTGGNHEISDDGKIVFYNTDFGLFGKTSSTVGDGRLVFALMHRHKSGKYVTPVPLDVLDSDEYVAIKNARCR